MKKNSVTKILTMLLASTMVLATVGCGSSDSTVKTDEDAAQKSSEVKVEESSASTEQVPEEPVDVTYPLDTDVQLSISNPPARE